MGGDDLDYKNMDYYFITERLTDYQLGMFKDGIENYLAMNYGTSDFAFSRINMKFWPAVNRYRQFLEKAVEGVD